jgi:hypothetical protein
LDPEISKDDSNTEANPDSVAEGTTAEEIPEGPSAEGPSAEGPTAEGPTAEGPTAEGPTAEGPTAEGPTAEGPTAEGPTAEGPTAEGPTAEGPTAEGPTAEGPTAEGPTAEGPTAEGPTAEGPTAEGPTAEGPTAEGSSPLFNAGDIVWCWQKGNPWWPSIVTKDYLSGDHKKFGMSNSAKSMTQYHVQVKDRPIREGVSKGVEDGRRPPALQAARPAGGPPPKRP